MDFDQGQAQTAMQTTVRTDAPLRCRIHAGARLGGGSFSLAAGLTLLLAHAPGAQASGYRAPAHSQMTYAYTCPSGASGHVSYTTDFATARVTRLTLWANGRDLHDLPEVSAALKVRNIEKVSASCGGDTTLIFIETYEPSRGESEALKTLTLTIDRTGTAVLLAD